MVSARRTLRRVYPSRYTPPSRKKAGYTGFCNILCIYARTLPRVPHEPSYCKPQPTILSVLCIGYPFTANDTLAARMFAYTWASGYCNRGLSGVGNGTVHLRGVVRVYCLASSCSPTVRLTRILVSRYHAERSLWHLIADPNGKILRFRSINR